MSVREAIRRRWMPRAIVALSTVRWPAKARARVRRALGRPARVELFVAFDDPWSAVALLGLCDRLAGRHAEIVVRPVAARGIPGDPALEAKRRYAVADATRLARRSGLELSRSEPVAAADAAFLAAWTAAAPPGPARTAFAAAAIRRLWTESDGPVDQRQYASLHHEHFGSAPPASAAALRRSERRMRLRRLYDTPAAVVHGQWFFAHERLPQIEQRLDELGWAAA